MHNHHHHQQHGETENDFGNWLYAYYSARHSILPANRFGLFHWDKKGHRSTTNTTYTKQCDMLSTCRSFSSTWNWIADKIYTMLYHRSSSLDVWIESHLRQRSFFIVRFVATATWLPIRADPCESELFEREWCDFFFQKFQIIVEMAHAVEVTTARSLAFWSIKH